MIRFPRMCSFPSYWRCAKYSAKRFCSNKTDNLVFSSSKPIPEESDTLVEKTAALNLGKTVDYKKISHGENTTKVLELIETLPSNPQHITMADVIDFYDNIRGSYLITSTLITHPKFNLIREATEVFLPQFNTKEIANILVTILPCKVLTNDKLSHMIIKALVERANHLPFDRVLFISFILHKYYRISELNEDYTILRLTFQRLFLSKIEDELDDLDDFDVLKKIVAFCNNNVEVITPKIANLITTSLLLIDDDDKFTLSDIISCFNLLASFGKLNEHHKKLMDKLTDLWCQSDVTAPVVRTLLRILSANRNTIDKEQLKGSKLIRHCVNVVTSQSDRSLLFSVQNEFNRLDITSHELIECLSKFFDDNIQHFTVIDYIIFCKACAKADYKPANWETKVFPTLKTFKFGIHLLKLNNFNWAEFVFDLDKLGYHDPRLIYKILNSKPLQSFNWYNQDNIEKLKEILDRCDTTTNNYCEELDSESSESDNETTTANVGNRDGSSMFADLSNMCGANKIWSNVRIEGNLTIPYVLKMDLESGEFLPITEVPRFNDNNELFIGIVLVPEKDGWPKENRIKYAKKQALRIQKKTNIVVIILDESKWGGLMAYEKALVFYTKIVNTLVIYRKYKLKKLATDI